MSPSLETQSFWLNGDGRQKLVADANKRDRAVFSGQAPRSLGQRAHPQPAGQEKSGFVPVCKERRSHLLPPSEGEDAIDKGREEEQSPERFREATPWGLRCGEQHQK